MTSSSPRSLQNTFNNLLNHGLRAATIALALTCLVPVAHVQAQTSEESGVRDIRSLNATEKQQLLEKIRQRLKRDFGAAKPFPGQVAFVPRKLKFRTEASNEVLVMDLGPITGPLLQNADMSEFAIQLDGAIFDLLLELGVSDPIIEYEYDGHSRYYYYPEEEREDRQHQLNYERNMRSKGGQAAIPSQGAKVVVSAMHGWYFQTGNKVWALQRPELSNGIYEDFITPTFVDPLSSWLYTRSASLIYLPRSQSTDIYPASGYPWWQMAGRYYLKEQYPAEGDTIWHTLSQPLPGPDHGPNMWHYDEDIRSRPKFANYIDADTLFNLHTNAAGQSASGTRAYVARNRSEDLALANNVLCGMKELIHAQDAYANFTVQDQAHVVGNLGENNLAEMPAMVLEVAFHTNPSDAAALKDPVFVDAAMKGVEKGFRLHAEGKVCKPFKITSIPDVTIQRPGTMNVPVNFEGFPFFPVVLTLEIIECPPGNTCSFSPKTYTEEQESPIIFTYGCGGTSSTVDVARWRAQLTDADNVKTNTVEFEATCLPNSGAVAKDKPSAGDAANL